MKIEIVIEIDIEVNIEIEIEMELEIETEIQVEIDIKVNNFSSFVKNNYLRDQSLKLDAKVSFTDKSIKFDNGRLINKKTLVNFKGDLIKKNKINIVRVDLTSDILDLDKLLLFSNKKKPIEVEYEKNQ